MRHDSQPLFFNRHRLDFVPNHQSLQEIADAFGDLAGMRFQREMSGIKEAYFRFRNVTFERLSTGWQKKRIVFAPHRQQRRLMRAEVFLKFRIQLDIAPVIAEQVSAVVWRARWRRSRPRG